MIECTANNTFGHTHVERKQAAQRVADDLIERAARDVGHPNLPEPRQQKDDKTSQEEDQVAGRHQHQIVAGGTVQPAERNDTNEQPDAPATSRSHASTPFRGCSRCTKDSAMAGGPPLQASFETHRFAMLLRMSVPVALRCAMRLRMI